MRHLLENAKYGEIPLDLMYKMAEGVPYLGVYQDPASAQDTIVDPENLPVAADEEIPVAWICSGTIGDGAKLITDERFRRRGFGRLLTVTLARRQAALLDFIPHVFVEADNLASKAMLDNLPGWSMTHKSIMLRKCQPQECV